MSTDEPTLFESVDDNGQTELIDADIGRVAGEAIQDDLWQVLNQHGDLSPSEIEDIVDTCQVCVSGVVNGHLEGRP